MDKSEAIEKIIRVLQEEGVVAASAPIKSSSTFVNELKIDGDDISFLVVPKLETAFGIRLPNEAWSKVETIGDAAQAFVDQYTARQQGVVTESEVSVDRNLSMRASFHVTTVLSYLLLVASLQRWVAIEVLYYYGLAVTLLLVLRAWKGVFPYSIPRLMTFSWLDLLHIYVPMGAVGAMANMGSMQFWYPTDHREWALVPWLAIGAFSNVLGVKPTFGKRELD